MYVVQWGFTDGDTWLDTGKPVCHSAAEVVVFRADADALIQEIKADADTTYVKLYECKEIELPLDT